MINKDKIIKNKIKNEIKNKNRRKKFINDLATAIDNKNKPKKKIIIIGTNNNKNKKKKKTNPCEDIYDYDKYIGKKCYQQIWNEAGCKGKAKYTKWHSDQTLKKLKEDSEIWFNKTGKEKCDGKGHYTIKDIEKKNVEKKEGFQNYLNHKQRNLINFNLTNKIKKGGKKAKTKIFDYDDLKKISTQNSIKFGYNQN